MSYNEEMQARNEALQKIQEKILALPSDAVRYGLAQELTAEQKTQVWANIGLNGLTLGYGADGLLYIFAGGVAVGNGIELPTGGIDGYITEDKQIVFNNLPDGEYTLAYVADDGTVVDIGSMEKDTNVYYSITNTLTNCGSSNSAVRAVAGESYAATITANDGYELESVAVTMGGADISSTAVSGGTITIAEVTGNIVVTAVAAVVQSGASYTNLANPSDAYWKDGYRLSISSGGTVALEGSITTNFIPAVAGDVLRVKGLDIKTKISSNNPKIVMYDTKDDESSVLGGLYGVDTANNDSFGQTVTIDGDISTLTLITANTGNQPSRLGDMQYIRIDGSLLDGYTANDVIITINEPIA